MFSSKSILFARILAVSLTMVTLSGCGLKLQDPKPKSQTSSSCDGLRENFPSSQKWSSDLLSALLECSQKSGKPLTLKANALGETADWLNRSFDSATRTQLVEFLNAIPAELGTTLQKFAQASSLDDQKFWPEWVRWTQIVLGNTNIRNDLLAEQLLILSEAPDESIVALAKMLEKLRLLDNQKRVAVLERIAKIYSDFSNDRTLQSFLIKGVAPLGCLKLEADRVDTSLISSGWALLLRSKNDPVDFGKTFVQSYGLLQNFCPVSEIPTHEETRVALDYFIQNHAELFAPILEITDQSTRALVPLLDLWANAPSTFDQSEFVVLLDALNKIVEVAKESDARALSTYVSLLANWPRGQSVQQITRDIKDFKNVPWSQLKVPHQVLKEWSTSAASAKTSFLAILSQYIRKNSHKKMAALLNAIKIKTSNSPQIPSKSPIDVPQIASIADDLQRFAAKSTAVPLPADAKFLQCLGQPGALGLWTCLIDLKQATPFGKAFMKQENANPLFFEMRDPDQPGRWLGQGFFSAAALPRWNRALSKLDGLEIPVAHFISNFPFADLTDDTRIQETYKWFRSAPQTQPESYTLRNELGIPFRIKEDDFSSPVWTAWFSDPTRWVPLQKLLGDPHKGPNTIDGLKRLTKRKIKVQLYKSDHEGLWLTGPGEIGMLSALDILLWEVPYDWTRKWIISKILNAKTPGDLAVVLSDSQDNLRTAFWALDVNPLTKHGKLWKKTQNAITILDATVSMRIESELFNWSEMMKALSSGLSDEDAEDFLVTLQKTGIISSISHLLHETNPTPARFTSSLIEVFHMIRNSRANALAWRTAVNENQWSHGLFVYQIFALSNGALDNPASYYHLKQMNALVKTGAYWIHTQNKLLPLKSALDTITGPETVFNPWIWIFLREIQDPHTKFRDPWMRLLRSLESSSARSDVRVWIDSGMPENIGSWMDAIILTPSTRF